MMMENNHLVSIITPLYNKEKYIEKTIQSVQAQTYTEWEMIIVDDCSSDAGAEIVKRYSEADSRIRYYKNETNMGAARSRNRAVELAKGHYIAFLDADDLWKAEKLETQISYMEQEKCAFCYSACEVVDENGNKSGKVRYVPEKVDYQLLLKGNPIPCLTVVLDRSQISQIEMKQIGHEDYVLWLDILKEKKYAHGINKILASYREYGSSLSGNKITAAKWMWHIYRKHLKLGIAESTYCFANYFGNAMRKRI